MSTFDLVCAKCGLLTTVAEQGKAGLKYRCRGCGTILEVPGSEHTEEPGGGEIVPPPLSSTPMGSGWGRATPLPPSKGQAAKPSETATPKGMAPPPGGHTYTMQGGIGARPKTPVTTSKPPPRPQDRPRDPNPGKEDPHSES